MKLELPKWQKDLDVYKNIKTAFIMEGSVHDLQSWVFPEEGISEQVNLGDYLHRFFDAEGYDTIIFYNKIDGFSNSISGSNLKTFADITSIDPQEKISFECATIAMRKALEQTEHAVSIIFDMANTATAGPDLLDENERECLTRLFLASKRQKQAISTKNGNLLTNLMIYIVEKNNDLPAWFYINNPYLKNITLTKPDKALRKNLISNNMSVFHDLKKLSDGEYLKIVDEIANLTEGFSNVELFGVLSLCEQRKIPAGRAREAINLFKYGETDSHWDDLDLDVITNAEEILTKRVKGQSKAVSKTTDILSRACLGLSGIRGGAFGRPKGVLFLAGPTGTGKTELAKAVAGLIFGDENFVTRFDMSEYQQAHSDQRLLGAPPGYVGYETGGQLTNAVKEKPFSVLLFDEIDKAHPTILDKFLQILEDGRMTDSAGETVYFSETLIIFTSNLGMIDVNAETGIRYQNISMDMTFEDVENKVLESIKNFFTLQIGRPEILNRIGDNFVIFDFIRDETVDEILRGQLDKIAENLLREKRIKLEIAESAYDSLRALAGKNLINGGRGIGNVVESSLINPLSRVFVNERIGDDRVIEILDFDGPDKLSYHISKFSE